MSKKLLLPKKVNKLSNVMKAVNNSGSALIQSASLLPPPETRADRADIKSTLKKAIKKVYKKK